MGRRIPRWKPEERKIAVKHLRRFYVLRRKLVRWDVLDSARELLVELYERGFDRSLDSCLMEIYKHRCGRFKYSRPELRDPTFRPAPRSGQDLPGV